MVVFENILEDVGGAGKYQYLQCFPLMFVLPAMSWHLLGNSFMYATPEKRCDMDRITTCGYDKTAYNESNGFNLGENDQLYRYLLITDASNKPKGNCRYRSYSNETAVCSLISNLNGRQLWNETEADFWTKPDEKLKNELDDFIKSNDFDTKGCDRWSYSDEYYDSTGVTEFDWVCDKDKRVENLQIAVMVGVFWGSPLFGWLSDNHGRKLTLCICFCLSFFSMAAVRFVSGSYTFLILCFLRMLDGAGAIGGIAAAFVLISEVFESKGYAKILVLQIGQSLFGVGQAALAGIVALNSDWRALSTIMAMPMLMAIFIWFFNDESARWLISRNRIDEANQILRKIAKVNGREVKPKYVLEETKDEEESDTPAESLTNAIKLPRMRGMILNLCYQWFMLSGIYYALAVKAATFGTNPFISYTISGFLEVPACFGTLLMYQFLGRRPSTFFLECFAGVTLVMIMFTPSSATALLSALPQLGKFFLTAVYGGIYVYTAEIFPTTIKNSGIGICSSIARIGGVASQIIEMIPKMCGEDSTMDCTKIPYAIYGIMTILGCILMFALPETKDQSSPETISEGNQFGKDQSGLLVQLVNLCSKKKSTKYNVSSSEEKRILSVNENNDLDKDPFYKDLPETNL